jgi:hypothetical protein
MKNGTDIDRFVRDPSLLIELCREVIDRLDNGPDDPKAGEKEAQLREIAKAIEKLEKMGVAVPDSLRAEKTRLAAALGIKTEASEALNLLTEEFQGILKDLKGRLNRSTRPPASTNQKGNRSRSLKTDKKVLREIIIKSLRTLGGRARVTAVIEEMGQLLNGKLLPGDLEWRESTSEYAWQNNAKWERYHMTQDGILCSDSPRGYWELNEDHR